MGGIIRSATFGGALFTGVACGLAINSGNTPGAWFYGALCGACLLGLRLMTRN